MGFNLGNYLNDNVFDKLKPEPISKTGKRKLEFKRLPTPAPIFKKFSDIP